MSKIVVDELIFAYTNRKKTNRCIGLNFKYNGKGCAMVIKATPDFLPVSFILGYEYTIQDLSLEEKTEELMKISSDFEIEFPDLIRTLLNSYRENIGWDF